MFVNVIISPWEENYPAVPWSNLRLKTRLILMNFVVPIWQQLTVVFFYRNQNAGEFWRSGRARNRVHKFSLYSQSMKLENHNSIYVLLSTKLPIIILRSANIVVLPCSSKKLLRSLIRPKLLRPLPQKVEYVLCRTVFSNSSEKDF